MKQNNEITYCHKIARTIDYTSIIELSKNQTPDYTNYQTENQSTIFICIFPETRDSNTEDRGLWLRECRK